MKARRLKSGKIIIEVTQNEVIDFFVGLGIGYSLVLLNKELKKESLGIKQEKEEVRPQGLIYIDK